MLTFNTQARILCLVMCTLWPTDDDTFTDGPAIKGFGKTANVVPDEPLNPDQEFNVVFDVGEQGTKGATNRGFDSLARFINLHIRAGIKPENINLALVVHGKAANDLLTDTMYESKFSAKNPNLALIKQLLNNRVKIYLCGQTAAYYAIEKDDLQPGVQMSLSAMTAHALLQHRGYTLNPF